MLPWIMRLKESITRNTNIFFACVFSAGFLGLASVLPILKNVLAKTYAITDFSEHVISQSTLSNSDIALRIQWYFLMMAAFIAVVTLLTLAFFYVYRDLKRTEENKKAVLFVKHTAILGSFSLIAALLAAYSVPQMMVVAAVFAVPLALAGLYLAFQNNIYRDYDLMFLSLALSIVLTVFAGTLFLRRTLSETTLTLLLLVISGGISLVLFLLFQTKLSKYKNKIIIASVPLMFTGIAQMAGLELLNILNKRFNLVLNIQYEMYVGFVILALVLGTVLWITSKKTKQGGKVDQLFLPMAILTLGLIIAQPSRITHIYPEFFEYANHGIAIDHLFRYGSIPIIENFDAHMLSSQFFGYLAQLFNGYEPWTASLYDGFYIPIYYVLVYAFLKRVLNTKTAFFFVLGFPMLRMLVHPTFTMALLMVIALDKLVKEDTQKNRTWFAIVCLVLCLYRLDIGFASVIAGVGAYILLYIKRGQGRRIFALIISGISTVLAFGVVYLAICFFKDIPPLARLREMMMAVSSNQNWAYLSAGDRLSFIYNLAYYVMPLALMALTLVFAFRYVSTKEKDGYSKPAISIFLFFVIFYFVNLPRGIVRHSLVEANTVWFVFGTFFPALLALSAVKKEGILRIVGFNVGLIAFLLIIGASYPYINPATSIVQTDHASTNLVATAYSSYNYTAQYTPAEPMEGTRVGGENIPQVEEFKQILDTVLKDDQTYVDLASMNYFYALTERKNPNYVNQMPMMLNGDTMQEMAIREIEAADAPLAILPIAIESDIGYGSSLDGVLTDYKYYLMFEYIYANYRPLVRLDGFDVYARSDVWDAYVEKLGGSIALMSGYDKVTLRKLVLVPLLWAQEMGNVTDGLINTDAEVGAETPFVADITTADTPVDLVLEMTTQQESMAEVSIMLNQEQTGTFSFIIKPGTHQYAIRLSADNNYWADGQRAFTLVSAGPSKLLSYTLISGE